MAVMTVYAKNKDACTYRVDITFKSDLDLTGVFYFGSRKSQVSQAVHSALKG